MDVILMQDVEELGEMGQTVNVSRGYARNFLLPQGLALTATPGNRNVLQEHMKLEAKRDDLRKAGAEERARQLGELSCTIAVQAGDDDKLFGSVTARSIVEALANENIELELKQVVLEEPIKQLGVYSVPVRLHAEVELTAKVWVVKA
ncbi:50S ribosomal protein L9 [bacterium]|nr:50S ribosomal protein L9 [bacterium]PIV81986.1 MAG: 50S ribosomal protein L9 [bacterium CG17_big_fil_post_rev_8_21_14_2_50_64_8]PJA74718.1 MAG: 50S ribosomal protein L9 [bacterium CG_4_9_14_3_um_filter_65_15]